MLFCPVSSGLTDEQKEFQRLALNFAHNEMFPQMAKWDQESIFPVEVQGGGGRGGEGGLRVKRGIVGRPVH